MKQDIPSCDTLSEVVDDTDMPQPSVDVVGVLVTALQLNTQVEIMTAWAKRRLSRVVCVANVHMLMESRHNSELEDTLASADLVAPDGMPLVWVMRSLGFVNQDRVAGMDIFEETCQRCSEEGISIYLLGSTQAVLEGMVSRLNRDFPQLKVAGFESPPFRDITPAEENATIDRINGSGAGMTFVSFGCPKQERWMANHYGRIHSVMVGIGAVFPVYAGLRSHAPKWVRYNGLEWLYRLLQEPHRLAGRYFQTIPPFIYLALRQVKFSKKNHGRPSMQVSSK
ncbi:MAG: WecB/TagA/CpsF family glycosyltransferase [Cyanobacteria bacterium J06555_13]